jgi:hypothetical protein
MKNGVEVSFSNNLVVTEVRMATLLTFMHLCCMMYR